MSQDQTPLHPEPRFVAKPWGGHYLHQLYGERAPVGTGEAWICSDLPGENGTEVKGVALKRLLRTPVPLVKLLDSTESLSVQLHPDNEIARRIHGPGYRGKWETWYFLRAPSEGFVYHGLAEGVEPAELMETIRADRNPEELLRRVRVRDGDALAVAPGTVHALTPGAVVAEVQTPADLTYRLYDWRRVGLDGKPRELHLEYSELTLAALSPEIRGAEAPAPTKGVPGRYTLASTGPLGFELIRGDESPVHLPPDVSANALVFVTIEGTTELRSLTGAWEPERLTGGDCLVVPPGSGEILVGGPGTVVLGYYVG